MKKKIVGLLMSLAMVISSFAGMAGLFPRVVSAADVTFPVHLTVAADESGRMPTGLTLTDAAYDKYFGGTEGAAAAAVPEILSAGKLFINETAFPKDSEAFAADGFSVNESALTVSETGDAYAAAAVAAATKAVPIGNTITLSDEDSDGVADKIEYYCYAASIVNKITDNGDGTFKIERADIQDGVKPYDDNLFKAGEGLTVKTSDTLVVGDMVLAYKAGNEWKAVKAYEANGILVDGQDHVSYTIDNVNYPDAMRFSRENIVISNRCGELTNAMKYFALNNKEGYEVSLWIVPTAEDCETTGAPSGFTTGTSGKKILGAAIEQAEAKLNSVVISTDRKSVV